MEILVGEGAGEPKEELWGKVLPPERLDQRDIAKAPRPYRSRRGIGAVAKRLRRLANPLLGLGLMRWVSPRPLRTCVTVARESPRCSASVAIVGWAMRSYFS